MPTPSIDPLNQPQQITPFPEQKKKLSTKKWVILLVGIFLLGFGVTLYFSYSSKRPIQPLSPSSNTTMQLGTVSPTPVPFVDMTIPYLRQRT